MGHGLGDLEQLVLLAILRLGDDAYGIAVQQEIATHGGRSVSLGAVYSTLSRLEEKGFVATREGPPTPTRGGRRKKLYTVRVSGREALRLSLAAVRALSRGLAPLLERS
jgi:PadR family transcriptional regulator, regulatory protein PadR